MSIIIAVVALAIALASVLINAYQVMTRHRPWVFVSSLRPVPRADYPGLVEIEVTNLGQLPAKGVEMSTTWGTFEQIASGREEAQPLKTALGVIFPNQKSHGITDTDAFSNYVYDGTDSVGVAVKLAYSSPRVAGWLGRHETMQYLLLSSDGLWGASNAGKADYT